MKHLYILITTLLFNTALFGQILFQATYGGSGNDFPVDLLPVDNGNTLLLANTTSFGQGNFDVLLMKIGPTGGIMWCKTYGGSGIDRGHDLSVAANGDILICGLTTSYGVGGEDLLVLRLDANGSVIWTKTIGGAGLEASRGAPIELVSGNIIITGYTESYGAGAKDIYLVKLDPIGNLIWTKTLGQGNDDDWIESSALAGANEIILNGRFDSNPSTENAGIMSIDTTGNVNWAKTYATSGQSKVMRTLKVPNGDILSVTNTDAFGAGQRDQLLMRTDAFGNVIWAKTFGGPLDDAGTCNISLFNSGDILFSGGTQSFGMGMRDLSLIKVDNIGNLVWAKVYGSTNEDNSIFGRGTFIQNDRILIKGLTTSFGAQGNDIYLIQADTNGVSGCNEMVFTPMVNLQAITPLNITMISGSGGSISTPPIVMAPCTFTEQILCSDSCIALLSLSNDTVICFGDTVQIMASGSGFGDIVWGPSSNLSDTISFQPLAWPSQTTNYFATYTDTAGCSIIDSVLITVVPPIFADAGSDRSICNGTSVIIGGSPTAPPGTLIQWTPSNVLDSVTIPNPTATPTSNTQMQVIVTDVNNCSSMDTMLITVIPQPDLIVGSDTVICQGDSTQLIAIGTGSIIWSPFSYLSDPNSMQPIAWPSQTTTYVATLTDTNTCSAQDSVLISVSVVTADAGSDQNVCEGTSVTIGGSPTGAVGTSFTWTPSGILNSSNVPNPVATPISNTVMYVIISDLNGCTSTDSMSLFVDPLPIIDGGMDFEICEGESVQINAIGIGSFSWDPSTWLSSPNIPDPISTPNSNIQYVVELTDANGCTSTDTVQINVTPSPIAQFVIDPNPAPFNDPVVDLINQSIDGTSFLWLFGANGIFGTSTDDSPTFEFPNIASNTYAITLFATNDLFCTDSTTLYLNIEVDINIYVPNTFSPNGDGINDAFYIQGDGIDQNNFELEIYDRWGLEIFSSTLVSESWDGTFKNGIDVPIGVYIWKLVTKGLNSSEKTIRFGQVTIVR